MPIAYASTGRVVNHLKVEPMVDCGVVGGEGWLMLAAVESLRALAQEALQATIQWSSADIASQIKSGFHTNLLRLLLPLPSPPSDAQWLA